MHLSIQLWQIWLTVGAVCVALLRVIPKVQPIVTPWLPPKWRTIPGVVLAAAGMVVGVAEAGADVGLLTTAIVVGLVAMASAFAPGALPAGAVAEPGVSLKAATKEITQLKAASKAGSIPPTAALLLLGLVGFGTTGCWFTPKGPLSPSDLPSSWICVEFLIGNPPVVGSAFCAGTTEEVLAEQDRRLRADPRIVGVRAVRQ
jgi:hypothetical protein